MFLVFAADGSALHAGLYFTLDGDRERSRNASRVMAYNMSDANLCELGRVSRAGNASQSDDDSDGSGGGESRLGGKLSAPTKRYSNPAEFVS